MQRGVLHRVSTRPSTTVSDPPFSFVLLLGLFQRPTGADPQTPAPHNTNNEPACCRYAIGSSLFGWMADTHGRKAALLASSVATAGVTLLCAASTDLAWYLNGRFLQGLTCSGLPITAYVLATESVGPAYRGRAGTASQLVYHVGEWALPLTALLLQDWRLLYVAVAACCVLTAALGLLVPESPRWQLLHGRQAAAARTLSWLAHLNGRQLTPEAAEQLVGGLCTQQEQTAADGQPAAVKDSKQAATATGRTAADSKQDRADDTQLQQDCSEAAALLCSAHSLQPHKAALQPDRCAHLQQHLQQQQQQHRQRLCHAQDAHQADSVWMIFTDPLLAKMFWVSCGWCCNSAEGSTAHVPFPRCSTHTHLRLQHTVRALRACSRAVRGSRVCRVAGGAGGRSAWSGAVDAVGAACFLCVCLMPAGQCLAVHCDGCCFFHCQPGHREAAGFAVCELHPDIHG